MSLQFFLKREIDKSHRELKFGEYVGCRSSFISVVEKNFLVIWCLCLDHELRTRNFRRSEKPALESINETLETEKNPKSKKKNTALLQHNDLGPRRSLRLSKLSSSNFSPENLLDMRRPTLFGTPEKDEISVEPYSSRLTYDFEKLELEDCSKFRAAHPRKVSLLYTPPNKGKQSLCKKSLGGDLMSFSPSM
ncbi:uncharacterized protein TNCV_2862271 [Trichonephila clavipes]|nr:uncharacterized protein TNCV_2862271 [Trichonephila clavipes]